MVLLDALLKHGPTEVIVKQFNMITELLYTVLILLPNICTPRTFTTCTTNTPSWLNPHWASASHPMEWMPILNLAAWTQAVCRPSDLHPGSICRKHTMLRLQHISSKDWPQQSHCSLTSFFPGGCWRYTFILFLWRNFSINCSERIAGFIRKYLS